MTQQIVVDTDMGVDDAAALGWLARQKIRPVEIVGVCSVWGNTSAERAASNALALLASLGHPDVPVAIGASGPIAGKASRVGMLAHGRDGMWSAAPPAPTGAAPLADALALYQEIARSHPGATLVAIGPLTNLARLLEAAPEALRTFERIVILGGAHHHGTMTPVSETNFWHDPEAADRVLAAGLPVTLVTRDAHRAFALRPEEIERATAGSSPLARHLSGSLHAYAQAARKFGEDVNLGDVVAAVLAIEPAVATRAAGAYVRVVGPENALVRGQSVMGFSPNERLTMVDGGAAVAELIDRVATHPDLDVRPLVGAILGRARDNANVVLGIDADRVRDAFLEVLA